MQRTTVTAPRIEDIELGSVQRDTVTGFKGKVTGRSDFLTGCAQALLEREIQTGDVIARWFDYPRLEPVPDDEPVPVIDEKRRTGGPSPAAGASRPAPR